MSEQIEEYRVESSCIFCSQHIENRIIARYGSVVALEDKYPVTKGHTLIIPISHRDDYFSMTEMEKRDAEALILQLRQQLLAEDPEISGFNIGMNCGEDAGQTVMHAHIYLIPRRKGDVENPRGGVRHVIPGDGFY